MSRIEHYTAEFVESFPTPMEPGVLYVSGIFSTAGHICPCGCGREVVTKLSPVRWKVVFDGESPCRRRSRRRVYRVTPITSSPVEKRTGVAVLTLMNGRKPDQSIGTRSTLPERLLLPRRAIGGRGFGDAQIDRAGSSTRLRLVQSARPRWSDSSRL